ncbi:DUF47 domain-containing protein [Chlamydiota bacterium]
MIFNNKESIVEELFSSQFEILGKIKNEFKRFINDYLKTSEKIAKDNYQINSLENQGDSLRRDIETKIEQGAFIPLYREDYILLAEMIDSILNRIQSTFVEIILTTPVFPESIHNDILKLTDIALETSSPILSIFNNLGEQTEKTKNDFDNIRKTEHDVDIIEQDLVRRIFLADIEYAQKLHLKEVIERIASFADLAEDIGDKLQIMAVKRTI